MPPDRGARRSAAAPDPAPGAASPSGRLLVVGTPIGNLGDLSPRATEALRSSELVVAEDTRLAARLLGHAGIRRRTVSLNEHNAAERLPLLLAELRRGGRLALTTDAGMPGISDPGAALIRAARDAGVRVEVVPGPSAVTAAFTVSGFAAPGFVFAGFLPTRPASARRAALEAALASSRQVGVPLIVFESPHRIRALLRELADAVPDAAVVVCRELTKLHEEVVTGPPGELVDALVEERGEFTLVIDTSAGGPPASVRPGGDGDALDAVRLVEAARRNGLTDRTILQILSAAGMRRRSAYRLIRGDVTASGSAASGRGVRRPVRRA